MATSLVTIRDPASLTTSPVLLSHPRSLSGTDRSARSYLIQRDLERPSRQVRRLTVSISAGRPLEFQPSIQSQQVPFTPPVAACQQTSDLSFEKESDNSDKSNAAIGTSTHCPYPFARIAAVALAAASCSLLLALSPAVAAGGNDGLLDIQTLRPRQQEQINESYVKRDGQDLSVSDLQGATFMEASLRGTDLHGSDLRGAMFTKAVLYKANLSGADLTDALIDRAVLNGADLRNAVLQGAWMALTDLGGADITGADFTDAIIDKYQLKQLCQRASGVNPLTGVDTAESLRCSSTRFYSGSGSTR